jgi:L,D-transpeptidase-like protein
VPVQRTSVTPGSVTGMRGWTRPASGAAAAVVALTLLGACGRPAARPSLGAEAAAPAATTTTMFPIFTVADVKVPSVLVYDAPGAPVARQQLANPNRDNAPLVFLVTSQQPDWLEVLLPARPNGSKGWVRAADATLRNVAWRMQVELGAHRITVWDGDQVVAQEPIAVGTAAAPTPAGQYYITELLTVPAYQRSAYGPFAFGISGHSDIYTTFGSGDGTIGIHGTGDPSSLGKSVSHGCIRLSNDTIVKLAGTLPTGTPVTIVA